MTMKQPTISRRALLASAPMATTPTGQKSKAPSITTGDVLQAIRRACKAHGVAPTVFGRKALGDPRLVHDLEQGRELRPATLQRIVECIEASGDLSFPEWVRRPRNKRTAPIDGSDYPRHCRMMRKGSANYLAAIVAAGGDHAFARKPAPAYIDPANFSDVYAMTGLGTCMGNGTATFRPLTGEERP